jgi:hypothetical protein
VGEHDTLVVAAAWAYPKYLEYDGYFGPVGRTFRDVGRLAFYAGRAIQREVPAILLRSEHEHLSRERAERLQQSDTEGQRALGRLVERLIAGGVYPEGQDTQLFALTAPGDERTVMPPRAVRNTKVNANGRVAAFVMGKRYTSLAALATGPSTTSELEARGG